MMLFVLAALASPTLVTAVTPVYPAAALAEGVTGVVVVRLSVDSTGSVTEVLLVEGVRADVDAVAIEAARRLQFTPPEEGAAVTLDYAFSFGLRVQDDVGNAVPGSALFILQDPHGMAVPGVSLLLIGPDGAELRVEAGDDGRASAPFLLAGTWSIVLESAGFASATTDIEVTSGETQTFAIELAPAKMMEVVVLGVRQRWREVARAGREPDPEPTTGVYEITRRDVESTPGALEDVNRAIHKLPGVASDGDLLSAFSVRGFTAGEVVFLLDRVPLDNPYHLAGFTSIFNPDMLESVRFHASASPAEYPDTTSAVVDVRSWDGAPKDDHHDLDGSVDLSLSTVRLLLMGPVGKGDDLTFALAARRSYLEGYFAAMQALNLLDTAIAAPEYDELSLRAAWRPGNHRLLLTAMRAGDHLALVDSDDESLITIDGTFELSDVLYLATLDHHFPLGERGSLQSTLSFSTSDSRMVRDFAGAVDRTTHRTQVFGRSDLVVPMGPAMTAGFGTAVTARRTAFDGPVDDVRALPTWSARPLADFGLPLLTLSQSEFATTWAGYAEHRFTPDEVRLRTRAGLRSTVVGRTGELLLSPSAGVSFPLPSATIPKLSGGLYHHVVEDPLVLDPTFGSPEIRSEKAAHIVVGVDQGLPFGAGTMVRVEGYHSTLWDLVVNPDTQAAVDLGTRYANEGSGHNAGVDLLVVSRFDRWQAALNVGWLHARRTNPFNEVFPTTVQPGHAQSLTLGVSAEYQVSPAWRVTARYDFHTGRPMSSVAVDGEDTVRMDALNDLRLGDLHQVDLRVEWRKAFSRLRWSVYVEVLNATYFQGDFLPIVSVTESERTDSMLTHLPTRPFLGVRADF